MCERDARRHARHASPRGSSLLPAPRVLPPCTAFARASVPCTAARALRTFTISYSIDTSASRHCALWQQKADKMDEEKLINMVRERRELYDLNHPLYDVRPKRDRAWEQIGEALKHSPRDCRDKWKRLRDCYRRAQKLRRMKSEQGAKIIKRPKYEQILTFLNPHLKDDVRNEQSPADCPDSSNDENSNVEEIPSPGTSSRDSIPNPYNRVCVEPALLPAEPSPTHSSYPAHVYTMTSTPAPAPPQHRDKITDFFMGLIETVKDLPEEVQIRVKRDVFKVVSDAEELVFKSKTENPLMGLGFVKEEN